MYVLCSVTPATCSIGASDFLDPGPPAVESRFLGGWRNAWHVTVSGAHLATVCLPRLLHSTAVLSVIIGPNLSLFNHFHLQWKGLLLPQKNQGKKLLQQGTGCHSTHGVGIFSLSNTISSAIQHSALYSTSNKGKQAALACVSCLKKDHAMPTSLAGHHRLQPTVLSSSPDAFLCMGGRCQRV